MNIHLLVKYIVSKGVAIIISLCEMKSLSQTSKILAEWAKNANGRLFKLIAKIILTYKYSKITH